MKRIQSLIWIVCYYFYFECKELNIDKVQNEGFYSDNVFDCSLEKK